MTRLVFLGELNPYGQDPAMALFHLPRGASGDRLRAHLGLSDATYAALEKRNLCAGPWDRRAAVEAVGRVVDGFDVVVALGVRPRAAVAAHFGCEPPDFFYAVRVGPHQYQPGGVTFAALPHPSGRNLAWDAPGARGMARLLMEAWVPEVPWGEVQ